jgi:hypothetical protein
MKNRTMFGAFVLVLMSCTLDHQQRNSVDAWSNPPPDNIHTIEWPKLQDSLFHIVQSSQMKKVDTILSQTQFVELSKSDASLFLGYEVKLSEENRPYLVRAIYLGDPKSGYSVQISNDSIIVFHGSLGHQAVPMKRYALIVLLKRRPRIVFNMCYRDE